MNLILTSGLRAVGCAAIALTLAIGTASAPSLVTGMVFAAPAHAVRPAQLALRVTDLPSGFEPLSSETKTAAAALKHQGMGAAELRATGFVAGYDNSFLANKFFTSGAKLPNGLILVSSLVAECKRPAGAKKLYSLVISMAPKQTHAFRTMIIRSIGNQSAGFTFTGSIKGGDRFTEDEVVLQRGKYVAIITGGGKSMTLGKEDAKVTGLAKIVDSRIAANG